MISVHNLVVHIFVVHKVVNHENTNKNAERHDVAPHFC